MHAASVHPEPGSNSLKFCISFRALRDYSRYLIYMDNCFRYTPTHSVKLSYLRALILAFSALWFVFQMNCRVFWLYLFQVTSITARPSLCTFPLLLFNFQGPSLSRFRLRSLAATRLVYHFLCSLSSTFLSFFKSFFRGSRDAFRSLFTRSLPYSCSSSSRTIYTRFFGSPTSRHPLPVRSILPSLPFVSSLSIPHLFIYCQVLLNKFFDIFGILVTFYTNSLLSRAFFGINCKHKHQRA